MAQILGRGLEPYEVNATGLTTVTCECDHKITTDNKYYKSLYVGFGTFYSQNCYAIFLKQ